MMVLATQEFVVVHRFGQMDFVADRTKISFLVEGFEKGLFVKGRFCLDELFVYPFQSGVLAESERIMKGFFDRVIGVSS